MMPAIEHIEEQRILLQSSLDAQKTQTERNQMGQFATPTPLAQEIIQHAKLLMPEDVAVRFLDPALGTGSFFSALQSVFTSAQIEQARGYEIDPHYARPALQIWQGGKLDLRIEDFTQAVPDSHFNLVICNPPYVRHHHLNGEKVRLKQAVLETINKPFSGLSGLYCYFLAIAHRWMAENALAGWLIPSEFMTVNYGKALQQYLLEQVTLLHIHRFDPNHVQFDDALVSSAVVWFRKAMPSPGHLVRFTYGGSIIHPEVEEHIPADILKSQSKWTSFPLSSATVQGGEPTIGDYFDIKRGLATGNNKYFILSSETIQKRRFPLDAFRPILPSPRFLEEDEIQADNAGLPLNAGNLFLLDCSWPEEFIRTNHPALWEYLEEGKSQGVNQGYLCSRRNPWYSQENRPPSLFVCTYIGRDNTARGKLFRFILNRSQAVVANSYLNLYPKPSLKTALKNNPDLDRPIWQLLDRISAQSLMQEGRVYGGGLHKLEPRELANVPVPALAELVETPWQQGVLFGV